MVYIVRYGEIGVKGDNRIFFERKLKDNIKLHLKDKKFDKVKRVRGRILIYSDDNLELLKNIFGIVSFSNALEVELDIEKIKEACLKLYKKGTFKISASRLEKDFMFNSEEINKKIGEFVVKNKNAKVNLNNPDKEISIELFNKKAYVFDNKTKGLGGLPVGVSGKVAVLLENENSLAAAFLMMKRGCKVCFVKGKDLEVEKLKKFYPYKIEVFDKIPEEIDVTVNSETLDSLNENKLKDRIIFKPLIGFKKEKINEIKDLL